MRGDGFNPIRHDCQRQGCYLECNSPRVEWFCSAFPGRSSFSDLDRIVEVGGRALVLDWKNSTGKITRGQEIMWQRLTRGGMVTAVVVRGDIPGMVIEAIRPCKNGKWKEWTECGTTEFFERMKQWADWAKQHPVASVRIESLREAEAA